MVRKGYSKKEMLNQLCFLKFIYFKMEISSEYLQLKESVERQA